MRESFVQYVWTKQDFDKTNLYTVQGESVTIVHQGVFTGLDGPDFFNAKVYLGQQLWAGNIEIHLRSSDWFAHRHETDVRYDTVILHVVWEYDVPVLRADGSEIPTLVLCDLVSTQLVNKCNELFIPKAKLNCEKEITNFSPFNWLQWKERLFVERLEYKVEPILELLQKEKNDWRFVFVCFLAKGFGGNTNGDYFLKLMLDLSHVSLFSCSLFQLEALVFGRAGFLDEVDISNDDYITRLQKEWFFLKEKYTLLSLDKQVLRFFQLRPRNFPTIRLAQFAAWLSKNQNNIQELLITKDLKDIYASFDIEVSPYWYNHYVFNSVSKPQTKKLTRDFIDLLFINTIVPMQFSFGSYLGNDVENKEQLIDLLMKVKPEKNTIVNFFNSLGVEVESALDTQALIHLKKEYCSQNRCLFCMIGKHLLAN